MSDPTTDRIREWQQITDAATEGRWSAWEPGFEVQAGPRGRIASVSYRKDAEFIAESRTAMPALLTAVENVLKLHHDGLHDECAYQEPGWRRQRCHFCGELWPCATVTAIRDALGGAA